ILAQAYDFSSPAVFQPSDILNIFPVIKHAFPRAGFASDALEHGRLSISQGQKETGMEIIKEAVGIYETVFGPMNLQTGSAYASLAMISFNNDDIQQAVVLQRRALLVYERCLGTDSAETLQQYVGLGC
ncbi:Intracellular distribution of mitochondria, partial [Kappamyces sp. JEL0680]